MTNTEKYRKFIFWLIPILGTIFGIWYINRSAVDVVYSDYIRLVVSYLPNVYNPKQFFRPDILTRVPINYLGRIINVELFGFSLTMDRILGMIGLGMAGLVFAGYCRQRKITLPWFFMVMAVMFSLNKWEMMINGSGWCHFLAFAGFYYHEVVLDRVWGGMEKPHDRLLLCLLPWLITLLTAGPYCASYSVVLLLSYACCFLRDRLGRQPEGEKRHPWILYGLCTLIPLLLYMYSKSFAFDEYAGDTGRSLVEILQDNPTFPIRFILKSFAGILIGGEELLGWLQTGQISNKVCCGLGLLVIVGYLWAYWLNLKLRLYEKHIMPLMLLTGGLINHVLVMLTRYVFEREEYALASSRYTLQFQVGVLGMILTFALAWQLQEGKKRYIRLVSLAFCLAFLLGNGYTTYREIKKAPYRKEYYEKIRQRVYGIPDMTDEEFEAQADELENVCEYWNGKERLRCAYTILKENHLNIYRD